jgi:hypothetical protein
MCYYRCVYADVVLLCVELVDMDDCLLWSAVWYHTDIAKSTKYVLLLLALLPRRPNDMTIWAVDT